MPRKNYKKKHNGRGKSLNTKKLLNQLKKTPIEEVLPNSEATTKKRE